MRITIPGLNVALTVNRAPFWRVEVARQPPPGGGPGASPSQSSNYTGDGLAVESRILDALQSDRFRAAYTAGMQTPHRIGGGNLRLHWRVLTCLWAAEHGLSLAGDFVECGVNTGILSRAICEYLDFARVPKRFYLFDTFEGIPESQAAPEERAHVRSKNARLYRDCYEDARKTFAPFPNVHLVRGLVPDTLTTVPIEQVSYLSIDMNLVFPEIKALEFFWERLAPGAFVVLDDYGFEGHRHQHDAIDAFAAKRNVGVYTSPTGQGLIVRPPS
jgi:O-methyltransferase